MNLCDAGHEQVCYDGGECPVCKMELEMLVKIDKLQKEVEELTS